MLFEYVLRGALIGIGIAVGVIVILAALGLSWLALVGIPDPWRIVVFMVIAFAVIGAVGGVATAMTHEE